MTLPTDPVLTRAWCALAALLAVATVAAAAWHRRRPSPETGNTLLRVRTWWLIVACFSIAMFLGRVGLAALLWAVSLLTLREFVRLDRQMPRPRLVWWLLAAAATAVYLPDLAPARGRVPGAQALVATPALLASLAAAGGSVRRALRTFAAFPLAGLGIAAVLRAVQPGDSGGAAMRPAFLLLLLTGLNDVAQYLWGKSLGGRPVVPRISPRKTWSGLLGGASTTALLAAVLAPWFTPLRPAEGLAAGLLLGFGGFAGDALASAYKRSVGAGASGALLPGHGGMLDRADSLCVTAPLFLGILKLVSLWRSG